MSNEWKHEERLFLNHELEREASHSGRRYFSRGRVKFALLELLLQEDMHGYQMIKALEEESGGTYKPSPGSIYPTLQLLRDQGYITSSKKEGKRVFTITEEGKLFLQEEKATVVASRSDAGGEAARELAPAESVREQVTAASTRSESSEATSEQASVRAMGEITSEHRLPEAIEEANNQGGGADSSLEAAATASPPTRNRRLTPKGRELFHLLRTAERLAISDELKAVQLRLILDQLQHSLLQLTEMDDEDAEDKK